MIRRSHLRRLIRAAAGGTVAADPVLSPPGPLFTANSAIHGDISDDASKAYVYTGGLAGTVDATHTAVIAANAGGAGIHGFNAGSVVGVYRSSYFVAQQGSTACVGKVFLQDYPSDSGKKIAISILTTDRGVESSTFATPIVVTAKAHGLLTGDSVTISGAVAFNGVSNVSSAANGTWTITKVDADRFSLDTSVGNGVGLTAGRVVSGIARATTVVTLTGTSTQYTVTASSTTPGAEYEFRVSNEVALGADSGARAYVGAQAVTCTGASGIFAGNYYRFHITGTSWFSNLDHFSGYVNYWTYTTGRGETSSTFAFLPMTLDSATLVVETGSLAYSQSNQLYSGFDLLIGTSTWQNHPNTAGIANQHIACTLPGTLTTCKLFNPGRNFQASQWGGTQHRALFFAQTDTFSLATVEHRIGVIALGPADSISDGFLALPQAQRAWVPLLRAATGRTIFDDANGGNTIYTYGGGTYPAEMASKIAQCSPQDILMPIGRNDYSQENGTTQSLATIMGYLRQQVDAHHAASPGATIWNMGIWNCTQDEPPHVNGQGNTVTVWRNAIFKHQRDLGYPSWYRVFETKNWTTFANYVADDYVGENGTPNDPVHPNSTGNAKIAVRVQAMLASTQMLISPRTSVTAVHSGAGINFTATGGSGTGQVWSLIANASGGAINASTGAWLPGSGTGTDTIKLIDSDGQVCTVDITVT